MNLLIFGFLLGLGAAIPIGPVNLEIMRRNLRFGTPYGISTGLGACGADITYLILLCLGALTLLQYPTVLRVIGFAGAIILAWFGIAAFRIKAKAPAESRKRPSLTRYFIEGYFITLVNPFTILFWASVSSQLSLAASKSQHAIVFAGSGVILGTVGWVLLLNGLIHLTRHRLTPRAIKWLNYSGGVILLGFAGMGLWKSLYLYF